MLKILQLDPGIKGSQGSRAKDIRGREFSPYVVDEVNGGQIQELIQSNGREKRAGREGGRRVDA
jgi:hypothetical protein